MLTITTDSLCVHIIKWFLNMHNTNNLVTRLPNGNYYIHFQFEI